MNDFDAELRELIEKHRDHPGADLLAMATALMAEGAKLRYERLALLGPFAREEGA